MSDLLSLKVFFIIITRIFNYLFYVVKHLTVHSHFSYIRGVIVHGNYLANGFKTFKFQSYV